MEKELEQANKDYCQDRITAITFYLAIARIIEDAFLDGITNEEIEKALKYSVG